LRVCLWLIYRSRHSLVRSHFLTNHLDQELKSAVSSLSHLPLSTSLSSSLSCFPFLHHHHYNTSFLLITTTKQQKQAKMFTKSIIAATALASTVVAQGRPANVSICDYYTTALLKNNTAENQKTLLTLVVNTAVIGNCTSSFLLSLASLSSSHLMHHASHPETYNYDSCG
jgi:hypothetical protein